MKTTALNVLDFWHTTPLIFLAVAYGLTFKLEKKII